jgi:hypothetical protein
MEKARGQNIWDQDAAHAGGPPASEFKGRDCGRSEGAPDGRTSVLEAIAVGRTGARGAQRSELEPNNLALGKFAGPPRRGQLSYDVQPPSTLVVRG